MAAPTAFLAAWIDKRRQSHLEQFELGGCDQIPPLHRKRGPGPKRGDVVVGSGAGELRSLDDAIDHVKPGGRIFVRAGVYRQPRAIATSKPFTLAGEGMTRSILVFEQAASDLGCLTIRGAGRWQIEHCALLGELAKGKHGSVVYCSERAVVAFAGCVVGGAPGFHANDSIAGAAIEPAKHAVVDLDRCHLVASFVGVLPHGRAKLRVDRSWIYATSYAICAVDADVSVATTIVAEVALSAIFSGGATTSITATKCTIDDVKRVGAYVAQGSVKLSHCTISRANYGVLVETRRSAIIDRCTLQDHVSAGCHVDGAATLTRNTIRRNGEGIHVGEGSTAQVTGNQISHNGRNGIVFAAKSSGTVRGNKVIDNTSHGVICDPHSRVKLQGNRVKDNGEADIFDYAKAIAYVRDELDVAARSGFYPVKALRAEAEQLVALELRNHAGLRAAMLDLADTLAKRQQAKEKTWKQVTDNDRLDRAFAELTRGGILAVQNLGDSVSDGWYLAEQQAKRLGRKMRGATYFHRQDLEMAVEAESVMLVFGAFAKGAKCRAATQEIGKEICDTLARHGVSTSWDGDVDSRIEVLISAWRKRAYTKAPRA